MSKMNQYQDLANKFADLIEKNEAPWQKSWNSNGFLPYNIKTGKEYNGINLLNLMCVAAYKGYEDNRWLTFLQAREQEAKVRAGEKGVHIMYLQTTETKKKIDEITGEEIVITEKLEKPRAVWSVVFNAEQCEGLPALEHKQIDFNPIEKAQEILDNSGAKIIHKKQNQAFYDKVTDIIILPLKEQFKSSEEYYRTALHELGHWTGHSSRNNRDLSSTFGTDSYAKEELVAEITSFLVGTQCGLGHEPDENNVAYLKSWSKAIRDEPSFLFNAVKEADRAAQLILGRELKLEKINSNEQIMEKEIPEINLSKNNSVTYINVPKNEKNEAKALGAKWDRNNVCWFVPANIDVSSFDKWEKVDEKDLVARKEQLQQNKKEITNKQEQKYILAVPYEEKDHVKSLGAEWDKNGKFWYCQESDKDKFFKWDIKNIENKVQSEMPLNIEEAFLNHIKTTGVLENSVIADGQKHRIAVDGDKGKEQSGFYVLHSDGVANGYFMNNRTGEEVKWISKDNTITPEEKAEMKALYQAKKAEREQQDEILTEKAEKVLYAKFMNKEAINEHTYLSNKKIEPTKNIYAGNDNTITVPLYNVDGRLKSAQYINENGEKRFAKNTNKVGAFHIVDGIVADLKATKSVIIAEGYATAASINEAINYKDVKVIAAMSANNIEHTVKTITDKYPEMNIVIAADNDLNNKVGNIGLNAANAARDKYKNVTVIVPKINGKEVAGDFNDIISKNGLSRDEALKNIQKSIKPVLNLSKTQEHAREKTITKTI